MTADLFASERFEGGWINLTTQRLLPTSLTSSSFITRSLAMQRSQVYDILLADDHNEMFQV